MGSNQSFLYYNGKRSNARVENFDPVLRSMFDFSRTLFDGLIVLSFVICERNLIMWNFKFVYVWFYSFNLLTIDVVSLKYFVC